MKNEQHAVELLQQGELVVIPTETVYGLAANAQDEQAVAKIFSLKQRPASNPLIVHIHHVAQLTDWAIDIPDIAFDLARTYWPGPLTLVLSKQPHVSSIITAGQDTVAIRIPRHPITLSLLAAFDGAVCAPSANQFMQLSPTQASHVTANFAERTPFILDGGPCQVGIESTIIDLSKPQANILRHGMISYTELQRLIPDLIDKPSTTRAPGQHHKHYQPKTPVMLVDSHALSTLALDDNCKLLSYSLPDKSTHIINMPNDPEPYAQCLYENMFQLDQKRLGIIYVERVPEQSHWLGIQDRLSKMASM